MQEDLIDISKLDYFRKVIPSTYQKKSKGKNKQVISFFCCRSYPLLFTILRTKDMNSSRLLNIKILNLCAPNNLFFTFLTFNFCHFLPLLLYFKYKLDLVLINIDNKKKFTIEYFITKIQMFDNTGYDYGIYT